ncbi:hypothetical protein LRS13_13960 [Svornostia abyssi]|uniref:Uncharacterized protein n=1 Tax=Svornostia abyssi TaxID=2898438 RepID=A0ABY5PAW6_9ACTN|nr:hypothetical protein LRS13_13960 [Parviterribacteraceae bacterium J379]
MEHLREGYERRREGGEDSVRRFERIRERSDGRFARGQDLAPAPAVAERAPVADLAPVDDLLAGWDADRPAGPIVREIVIERDDAPRRPRREVATAFSTDRDPSAPRDVEVAELRGGRRTVEIRGRTVASPAPMPDRDAVAAPAVRRRESGGAVEVFGQRPDRIALWALLLGIVLILVAMGSGDASAATF